MKTKLLLSLGIVWALPMTIFGLAVVAFYGVLRWRLSFPCLEFVVKKTIPKWAMGQAFGCVVVYSGPIYKERRQSASWAAVDRERRTLRHERRHVLQTFVFGPLFPIVYGIGLVYAVVRCRGWYQGNPLEVDARSAEDKKPSF